MLRIRKIVSAGLVAVTLAASLAATTTPAAAWGYRHHYGWGYHPYYGWGLGGLAAGLALGAAAAAAAAPVYYGYGGCYITRQPVVDAYGNVLYFRRVRVCN